MTNKNYFGKAIKVLLTISLLLGYVNLGICQKIGFGCYTKSVCSDSIALLKTNYSLQSKDTTYYSHNGICFISKKGEYTFNSAYINIGVKPIVFKISSLNEKFQSDTLQIPELFPVLVVHYGGHIHQRKSYLKSGDWVYCGKKADSYKVDYYLNGYKRIEGVFRNGKPVETVNYYSENSGKLIYTECYNKQGKKISENYIEN